MSDTKHGRVIPRPDGLMARCGGPGICTTCDAEREHEAMRTAVRTVPQIPTHASYLADVARAAHQTGKDLTLEEVAAVIEAVNSLAAPGVSTVEDAQDGVPADVMAALNRMCTPLDASILKGATADADAFCMQLIRDYILRRPAPAADYALPSKPGVYAWSAGTSNALVLVDRRPSAHSPAGVLNGHVIESTRFYDGCAVESWGRDGRWTLLHDFDTALAAQRKGDAR